MRSDDQVVSSRTPRYTTHGRTSNQFIQNIEQFIENWSGEIGTCRAKIASYANSSLTVFQQTSWWLLRTQHGVAKRKPACYNKWRMNVYREVPGTWMSPIDPPLSTVEQLAVNGLSSWLLRLLSRRASLKSSTWCRTLSLWKASSLRSHDVAWDLLQSHTYQARIV